VAHPPMPLLAHPQQEHGNLAARAASLRMFVGPARKMNSTAEGAIPSIEPSEIERIAHLQDEADDLHMAARIFFRAAPWSLGIGLPRCLLRSENASQERLPRNRAISRKPVGRPKDSVATAIIRHKATAIRIRIRGTEFAVGHEDAEPLSSRHDRGPSDANTLFGPAPRP